MYFHCFTYVQRIHLMIVLVPVRMQTTYCTFALFGCFLYEGCHGHSMALGHNRYFYVWCSEDLITEHMYVRDNSVRQMIDDSLLQF